MKKAIPYLLIIVLAITLVLVKKCKSEPSAVNRNRGFDRRTSFIELTRHAKCRMECRNISLEEVKEIMQEGRINYNKSEASGRPCPTYALEGVTSDQQKVRIVYAQCDSKTKIVTVIDLNREWECDCPGDEKKYKNRN